MMDSNESMTALHVIIEGRVQGVFFRSWATEQANGLGLRGWIRNRNDGTVEAVVAGPPDKVDAMVRLCHEGPPAADVSNVRTSPSEPLEETGFQSKPTA